MINIKLDNKAKNVISKTADMDGGGSNVYVCNFLEDTSSTTLTNEQVTEFITNITNPNVISKFSRLNSSFENISIISVSTEIDAETSEPFIYYCWGFFNGYYYSVSLNIKTNDMQIEQP